MGLDQVEDVFRRAADDGPLTVRVLTHHYRPLDDFRMRHHGGDEFRIALRGIVQPRRFVFVFLGTHQIPWCETE